MPEDKLPNFDGPDFWDSLPPPDPPEDWGWVDQSLAEAEEKNWPDLEKVLKENDVAWAKAYGKIVLVFTVVFSSIFVLSLAAWSAHYILPKCWLWLSDDQLSKIQSVLFSGGMGAIISSIIRKQMDRVNKR